MPRFFTNAIQGDTALIDGDDARHIAGSLRMRAGDSVTVCDLAGYDYDCVITNISDQEITLNITEKMPCKSEPNVRIHLFQALPKSDKLELIVQKAVELGVHEITPVLTERCISRPDQKSMDKKLSRLEKISLEAAKQSGRGIIPKLNPLIDFKNAVLEMKKSAVPLFFYELSQTPLREFVTDSVRSISLMIGSEGGFSTGEAAFAEKQGLCIASLGPRILRCETAPICAISCILYALGE